MLSSDPSNFASSAFSLFTRSAWLHQIASTLTVYARYDPDTDRVQRLIHKGLVAICEQESLVTFGRKLLEDGIKDGLSREEATTILDEGFAKRKEELEQF